MNERHSNFFNVFNIDSFIGRNAVDADFRKRGYHKIMLVKGSGEFLYLDNVIQIDGYALIFASPGISHTWRRRDLLSGGYSCVFDTKFLRDGFMDAHFLESGETHVFKLDQYQYRNLESLFQKMLSEIESDYPYKYHLLKVFTYELVHFGLKEYERLFTKVQLQSNADRLFSGFLDLLGREFPIDDPQQVIALRSAEDFAQKLYIHVNHLNRMVKAVSTKTTSHWIQVRIFQEAETLLSHTNWTVSQIAYSLGYSEVTHFSKFFKRHALVTPRDYRKSLNRADIGLN
ncbi:AraC family transcriptional regulator [Pedobacter panaciterrae]|uniref:AraC family transcriptional regulator n=1 Tax=Pedobacter panaciterrae TaxID=363849 RepID=A0ABU8NHJ9_9SPHI